MMGGALLAGKVGESSSDTTVRMKHGAHSGCLPFLHCTTV